MIPSEGSERARDRVRQSVHVAQVHRGEEQGSFYLNQDNIDHKNVTHNVIQDFPGPSASKVVSPTLDPGARRYLKNPAKSASSQSKGKSVPREEVLAWLADLAYDVLCQEINNGGGGQSQSQSPSGHLPRDATRAANMAAKEKSDPEATEGIRTRRGAERRVPRRDPNQDSPTNLFEARLKERFGKHRVSSSGAVPGPATRPGYSAGASASRSPTSATSATSATSPTSATFVTSANQSSVTATRANYPLQPITRNGRQRAKEAAASVMHRIRRINHSLVQKLGIRIDRQSPRDERGGGDKIRRNRVQGKAKRSNVEWRGMVSDCEDCASFDSNCSGCRALNVNVINVPGHNKSGNVVRSVRRRSITASKRKRGGAAGPSTRSMSHLRSRRQFVNAAVSPAPRPAPLPDKSLVMAAGAERETRARNTNTTEMKRSGEQRPNEDDGDSANDLATLDDIDSIIFTPTQVGDNNNKRQDEIHVVGNDDRLWRRSEEELSESEGVYSSPNKDSEGVSTCADCSGPFDLSLEDQIDLRMVASASWRFSRPDEDNNEAGTVKDQGSEMGDSGISSGSSLAVQKRAKKQVFFNEYVNKVNRRLTSDEAKEEEADPNFTLFEKDVAKESSRAHFPEKGTGTEINHFRAERLMNVSFIKGYADKYSGTDNFVLGKEEKLAIFSSSRNLPLRSHATSSQYSKISELTDSEGSDVGEVDEGHVSFFDSLNITA